MSVNECPVLYDIMGPLKICFSVDAILVATTSPLGFLSDLEQLGDIVLPRARFVVCFVLLVEGFVGSISP